MWPTKGLAGGGGGASAKTARLWVDGGLETVTWRCVPEPSHARTSARCLCASCAAATRRGFLCSQAGARRAGAGAPAAPLRPAGTFGCPRQGSSRWQRCDLCGASPAFDPSAAWRRLPCMSVNSDPGWSPKTWSSRTKPLAAYKQSLWLRTGVRTRRGRRGAGAGAVPQPREQDGHARPHGRPRGDVRRATGARPPPPPSRTNRTRRVRLVR
jgi:hypothetical protein